ncbi:hypothetical protein OAL09_00570 [Verrucomicrobia bacterium]|nr:hypothetical protein [Verrucomicrobiota bacterium]
MNKPGFLLGLFFDPYLANIIYFLHMKFIKAELIMNAPFAKCSMPLLESIKSNTRGMDISPEKKLIPETIKNNIISLVLECLPLLKTKLTLSLKAIVFDSMNAKTLLIMVRDSFKSFEMCSPIAGFIVEPKVYTRITCIIVVSNPQNPYLII